MEYLNLNGTGLDKVYTINKIKNPDAYLYFCHLKDEVFIDEIEVINPITGNTKIKEKLPLTSKIRTAEIGKFIHYFLLPENVKLPKQEYFIYGNYDFLSGNFSSFKGFTEIKKSNLPYDPNRLCAKFNFGEEKGVWEIPNIELAKIVWQIKNIRKKVGSAELCEILKEYNKESIPFSIIKNQLTEAEKLYLEI